MIFSIANFFIRRPVFSTVLSVFILIVGAACIPTLPVAQYPNVTPPQIVVTSRYVGANAEVVESTVTNLLERELNGIDGLRYIKSTSANDGTSNIALTFDLDRNQDIVATDVQNRVSSVQPRLPDLVNRTGIQVTKANSSFLLAIGLYAEPDANGKDRYDDIYLSNYADLYITDALKRIKGVENVQIFGERQYAMRIWLDPLKLAARNLTPQDVVQAIREQNLQVGAGQIGQPPVPPGQEFQYSVTAQGRLANAEEFAKLVIRTEPNGSLLRLKDVARVELGAENYSSILRFTSDDGVSHRGVGLGIRQQLGSNALAVAKQVKARMQELQKSFPPGLKYEIAFDTTLFVEAGTQEVITSLILAIFLVVLIIFLFLQNWRSALITSIAIPVALVGTFIFVKIFGFSINTLTLFGLTLATGLVVDDAIVIVEDITKRIQEDGMAPLPAAMASMDALFGAVIATSIVLITVFVPVAFLPGTTGQLYRQFALTIAFAITISTFNAITLTPTLAALLIRPGQVPNHFVFRWLNQRLEELRQNYRESLQGVVQRKNVILALFCLALVLTYGAYNLIPKAFLPDEDQGYFITVVQAPQGVSLEYTERVLQKAEAILKTQPEIRNIFAVGGFSFSGATPNVGLIFATMRPWSERPRPEQSVTGVIGGFFPPPARGLFPQFLGIKEAVVIPFSPPAISGVGNFGGFEFHLQDRVGLGLSVLGETLDQFLEAAKKFPNPDRPVLTRLRADFSGNTPQIEVQVNRERANALGIKVSDIFNTLQTLLGSTYVNDFNQFQRTYRVYVQADGSFRTNPANLNQFYVRSQNNQMISLGNLITVRQITAPAVISHFNLFRSVEINGVASRGKSSGEAIQALETVAQQALPRGFGYEWSGLSLEEIESAGQAIGIFALGVVFVFLTLAAQYENYIDPFIIMLTVPLAVLGALMTVFLRGLTIDVYTQIGFVMLIGMASKNAILIVEFANQLVAEGLGITKAVLEACRERLRPILMTALSTLIGAFPLWMATGAGAAARRSLGTCIVGGMGIASLLSLFIVPVLYIVIKNLEARYLKRVPPV
ncbi:efflux RND transporter permease subunit [Synechococcus sp. C9]|uniref:efflux RND transporter permease subunit n=1 Tax=Synechococcus sp. C9 TaxID=102119 RepID=UPI001FF60E4F|nr:efflux RND transporter permease subunit [Synechococcus sp. C9]